MNAFKEEISSLKNEVKGLWRKETIIRTTIGNFEFYKLNIEKYQLFIICFDCRILIERSFIILIDG